MLGNERSRCRWRIDRSSVEGNRVIDLSEKGTTDACGLRHVNSLFSGSHRNIPHSEVSGLIV